MTDFSLFATLKKANANFKVLKSALHIGNTNFSILKLAFTFISVANKTSFYAKVMSRKRLDICFHAALITPKQ